MSRSQINLFPKHHILAMLGLANVRQHIPQFSWKSPGRDIYQRSGHSLPNTKECDSPSVNTDTGVAKTMVFSHCWKQFQMGNCLSQLKSLRGVCIPLSLDTSSTESLDCWGCRHCRGKSS